MRGQITVFIIAGLLLLVMVALGLWMTDELSERMNKDIDKRFLVRSSSEPVRLYVEECLREVAEGPINAIGLNGGTLALEKYRWFESERINYLAYNEPGFGPRHALVLRQDMESELEDSIRMALPRCIDLGVFERQGFDVKTGNIDVNVTIGLYRVFIEISYPITLYRDDLELTNTVFSTEIDKPLGLLFERSVEIINEEASGGHFDIIEYMQRNDEASVEKHRPYPDIVYLLELDSYIFRFAIEGEDTSAVPGSFSVPEQEGCCYNLYDNLCYKNVPLGLCERRGGLYDPNPGCRCPTTDHQEEKTCEGKDCKDCLRTYDPVTGKISSISREHGESWCVYETPAGGGYDYVGARHYVHYCIDGIEYVEECRDFREELCTQEQLTVLEESYTKAVCRANRWEDCHRCETEECCHDLRYRDCEWKGWLTTESRCMPAVPPGFSFWEYSGRDVCSLATETKECSGFSCPNVWIDDSAIRCYAQGDCGNYRNYENALTYEGYYNTDPSDSVRSYVYHDETDINNRQVLNLGTGNRQRGEIFYPEVEATDNFLEIMTTGLRYIESLSSISISDFLNPFVEPDFSIMDVGLCDVWQSPTGGDDCSLCTQDAMHPCTEYRCRSLGQMCRYKEVQGVPDCYAEVQSDKEPPTISLDTGSMEGRELDEMELEIHRKTYNGYNIAPALLPYQMLSLKVNTSEPARCSLRYGPRLEHFRFPSHTFGNSGYSTGHKISMRIPSRLEMPDKVLDMFNVTSLGEIVEMLEEPRKALEQYKGKYRTELSMLEKLTGRDLVADIEPYADEILAFIEEFTDLVPFYRELFRVMLESFEKGQYFLFIECTDAAGNINEEEVFVRVDVKPLGEDKSPPRILGFEPEPGSYVEHDADEILLTFYTDEPAECRYGEDTSFEKMEGSFDCTSSRYAMVPKHGGSYRCTGMINVTETVYIRCRDNPPQSSIYEMRVKRANDYELIGIDESGYLRFEDKRLKASASMLRHDFTANIASGTLQLDLYTDDLMSCRYSYAGSSGGFGSCRYTGDVKLGQYLCPADIPLETYSEDNVSFSLEIRPEELENSQAKVSGREIMINISKTKGQDITAYLNRTDIDLEIFIPGRYQCRLDEDEMACIAGNSTTCSASVHKNDTYEILCLERVRGIADKSSLEIVCELPSNATRNTFEKSMAYSVKRSPGLKILETGPGDEVFTDHAELYVRTSPNPGTRCGYHQELMLATLFMNNNSLEEHTAEVEAQEGFNTYNIICKDSYGNKAKGMIEFYAVR